MRITPSHPPLRHPTKDAVDPGEYVAIVGQTFLKHERRPLLEIGTKTWSRWSLGRLGCPHPMAASALNRVLQTLEIRSLPVLAMRAQEVGAFKGLGVTAYWIVLAILREAGFDVDLVHGETVSYQTQKARAKKQSAKARVRHKKRSKADADDDIARQLPRYHSEGATIQ